MNTRYRVRAQGVFRGRPLEPFEYQTTATVIENLFLIPIAPFFAPSAARMRFRHDMVKALTAHLAAALIAADDRPKEGGS